jgi:hypothetical protein
MKIFTERVKDCELQLCSSDLQKLSKLKLYCNFKYSRSEELYLSLHIPKRLRRDLARFRTNSHKLEIEIGRHNNVAPEDRLCKLCAGVNISAVEDEVHVLFYCVAYTESRHLLLDCETLNIRNEYTFIRLMNTDNVNTLVNLAKFISYIFKTREQLLLPP